MIRLNAFDMATPGHIQQGMWTHPRDNSAGYASLEHWTSLARLLERGLFDGLFLADVLGVYDVHGGTPDAALRGGVQAPLLDPLMLVPAMAAVTTHLGFGVTCNLAYEPPYLFARRMSTLDHLTNGRIGWNIVTGYLDSAARALGYDAQMLHDDRYDLADEYMEAVYALWEGSWADDAVRRDRAGAIYTNPARVRLVRHHGRQYRMEAIHLCEPSPQRTPVLYQAGASERGRRFAGTHAECVFVNGSSPAVVAALAADLRARAAPRPCWCSPAQPSWWAGRSAKPTTCWPTTLATPAQRQPWPTRRRRWALISRNTAWTSQLRPGRATRSSPTSRRWRGWPGRGGQSGRCCSNPCWAAASRPSWATRGKSRTPCKAGLPRAWTASTCPGR